MALDKAKKQVQLYGGITDNVDDFLIPSPAVAYAENCHWRGKEGKLVKRLGSHQSTGTDAPTNTLPPTTLHPIKDKLYTFEGGRSYEYNTTNDSWSNKPQVPFFSDLQSFAKSQLGNVVCQDIFRWSDGTTVLVYSLKVRPSDPKVAGDAEFESYVVTYDGQGTVIATTQIEAAAVVGTPESKGPVAPKIVPYTDSVAKAAIIYCDAGVTSGQNDLYRRELDITTGALGSASVVASDVEVRAQLVPGERATYQNDSPLGAGIGYPWYAVSNKGNAESTLLTIGGLNRHLIWTQASTGNLHVKESDDGFDTTTQNFVISAPANTVLRALATCTTDDHTTDFFIQYVEQSTQVGTNYATDVKCVSYPMGSSTANWTQTLFSDSWRAHAYGTILESQGSVWYAFGAAEVRDGITGFEPPESHLGILSVSTGAATFTNTLTGHRLVSSLHYNSAIAKVVALMQMWNYPPVVSAVDNDEGGDAIDGYLRPVSTVLTDLSFPTLPTAIGAVDTLQSKHVDFSDTLSNQMLPSLIRDRDDENKLIVANREIFTVEGYYGTTEGGSSYRAGDMAAQARINIYELSLTKTAELPGTSLGDGLILPAGTPLYFDGDVLSEMTPLGAPEVMALRDAGQTSGSNYTPIEYGFKEFTSRWSGAQLRTFQAVVTYTDAQGNLHRSAPSPLYYSPFFVPTTAGSWNNDNGFWMQATISTPLSMNPRGNRGRYDVELYISDTPTSTPRLAARQPFDPYAGSVDIEFRNVARPDGAGATTNVITKTRSTPFIYTNGDVLASDTWPMFTHTIATSTRLWALSANDVGQVYYSKLFEEFIGPEFNAALTLSLGDERQLTAIGRLDDKVVVFEQDDIHVIYGPGPDNTGTAGRQGGFEVHHVTSDVGCSDPASVVETPQGLMFKGRRGFYLLDRGLQLHFVGGGVQDITRNTTVTAANIVPEFAEVRFHLEVTTGESQVPEFGADPASTVNDRPARPRYGNVLPTDGCVVYNYEMGRWTVFSNYPGTATCLTTDGRYARIQENWGIFVEAPEEDDWWQDGLLQNYWMKVVTPHIPLAETVQGYARLRRVSLLGRYMSSFADNGAGRIKAGDIKITPRYDFEATDGTSRLWRANDELQTGERFQLRFKPERQKCQAVQLVIEEQNTESYTVPDDSYASGRGFELVVIDLDLGVKDGPVRSIDAGRKK